MIETQLQPTNDQMETSGNSALAAHDTVLTNTALGLKPRIKTGSNLAGKAAVSLYVTAGREDELTLEVETRNVTALEF